MMAKMTVIISFGLLASCSAAPGTKGAMSCDSGSCLESAAEEPSLVQRSHQHTKVHSSSMQSQVEEMHRKLRAGTLGSPMLAQLEAMATNLINQNLSEVDPETKNLLQSISTLLEESFMNSMTQAHDEDQQELNNASARVAACNSQLAADRPPTTDLDSKRDDHINCRADELVKHGENETHTAAYHTFLTATLPPPPNTAMPERWPPSDAMRSFLQAFKDYGTTYLAQLEGLEPPWENAHNALAAKKLACGSAQTAFESSFCVWRNGMDSVCSTYTTCYADKLKAFEDTKTNVVAMEETRKLEHSSIKKVICQIGVLLSNATTAERQAQMTACNDEATSGEFDIVVPTVPASETCDQSDMQFEGCDAAFHAKEYKDISPDTPLQQCVPCAAAKSLASEE